MRLCSEPRCPAPVSSGRCADHRRAYERERGTRQQRGYDAAHDRMRRTWQKRLDSGELIACSNPTCQSPGIPVDPKRWHLGHTPDRTTWRGPEHPTCNLAEAGRAAHS